MKRSRTVSLTLVPIVGAFYAGCEPAPTHQKVCVDEGQRVIVESECEVKNQQPPIRPGYYPHWYYVPYQTNGYAIGQMMSGGSVSPPPQASSRIVSGHQAAPSSPSKTSPAETGGFGGTWHGAAS